MPVDETTWYAAAAAPPGGLSSVHGDPGPVALPGVAAMAAHSSAATVVVAVAPEAKLEDWPLPVLDLSSGEEAAIPDISRTVTPPLPLPTPRLLPEIETAVCPPAQLGSAHANASAQSVNPSVPCAAASDAKFPALPPRVMPETDAADPLLPLEAMRTSRQFPAMVDGIVGVRLFDLVMLTTDMEPLPPGAGTPGEPELYPVPAIRPALAACGPVNGAGVVAAEVTAAARVPELKPR